MTLRIFNTLSRKKELFKPIHKGRADMYTCGPTVYQYAHIGNIRAFVTADTLKRALKFTGFKVRHVINITDVGHLTSGGDEGEDKMEAEAQREHKSAQDIARFYTKAFRNDLRLLTIDVKDTKFPGAAKHVKEQIGLIQTLEKKGFTYRTSDGIYFDTSKFKTYGKFARLNLKGLREGARIGIHAEKRNAADFALWKFSPKEGVREQEWDSPWGIGFPGWHIECSAMSMKYLGKHFDIHTGGIDHIPVHHTNEIAQSESATGKKFVNYWIHNEFVNMGGEKMAKSLGNTLTLADLKKDGVSPAAYRYWLLTAHYRSPVMFSLEAVHGAGKALLRIISTITEAPSGGRPVPRYMKKFTAYVEDDLDTPRAIALMWELLKDEKISPRDKRATVFEFDKVLGLNLKRLATSAKRASHAVVPENIRKLLNEREEARKRKDWATADKLRDAIHTLGYEIKDTGGGSQVIKISS